jgi:hypothetical protein
VDPHGHVLGVGLQALSANLLPPPDGEGNDIAALQRLLRDWIGRNGPVKVGAGPLVQRSRRKVQPAPPVCVAAPA